MRDASELRVKESDRIATMAAGLKACGVEVAETQDGIDIVGTGSTGIRGGTVDGAGDHRVCMAFAMAGWSSRNGVTVNDCANIKTSFPTFDEVANAAHMRVSEK